VALLASMPANFAYGHPLDAKLRERFFDLVKPARSYNRLYFSHDVLASNASG